MDLAPPDGFNSGDLWGVMSGAGIFDYVYDASAMPFASDTQRHAGAVQLFYTANWLHDSFYDSGFDDAAGNAQTDNYGRGGIEGDAIQAQVEGKIEGFQNNASMSVLGDGEPPFLLTGQWQASPELFVEGTKVKARGAFFGTSSYDVAGQIQLYQDGQSPASDACIYAFTDEVVRRKEDIIARDGRFVLRPDSVTKKHPSSSELTLALMNKLWDGFGGQVNSKGFRVLDDHIRVIWGDGIDPQGISAILRLLQENGFSADNMVFGMGGGLLQKVNRDTQRFAFKSSAQKRSGVWHDVSKNPLDASKASKAGRLKLVSNGGYKTVKESEDGEDLPVPVFRDGLILKRYTFDEIRQNANGG